MKTNKKDIGRFDIDTTKFTKEVNVYLDYNEESEEEIEENFLKKKRSTRNSNIENKVTFKDKVEVINPSGNKRSSIMQENAPKKKIISSNSENRISSIPIKSSNIISKAISAVRIEEPKSKLTEKDLGNPDFGIIDDEIIPKKEEFKKIANLKKFTKSYNDFLNDERFSLLTNQIKNRKDYVEENLDKFQILYQYVESKGGYEQVIMNLQFQNFNREFDIYLTNKEAKQDYIDFIYHYALFIHQMNKSNTKKVSQKEADEIIDRDPNMILECPIITAQDSDTDEDIRTKIKEAMKYDLVILRGFLPKFNLNNSVFSMDYLNKNYNNKIDVVEQSRNFSGFTQNKHVRKRWRLDKYLEYVVKEEEKLLDKNSNNDSKNKNSINKVSSLIYYGVNIELTNYKSLYEELETKVHPLLLFGSKYDSLAYVRQHINGMTVPQMYIKVKDAWTGGHEENLRMRSINISHGPGESYWWATPVEDSQKLVEKVEEIHNFNIYKKEGIWFPETEFFLKNKIRVISTVQKEGDIVLVGTGAIHWVKAKSHAINTSWNFGRKESEEFKVSMERYKINKEIKFRSLVPMMTLFLDILNDEMFELDWKIVQTLSDYITPTIEKAIEEYNTINQENKLKSEFGLSKESEEYLVDYCESCVAEIFNCWGFCLPCSTKTNSKILCYDCFKDHFKICYKPHQQYIFYKYELEDLNEFLRRLKLKLKYDMIQLEDEIKTPQPGLKKKTKDSQMIFIKRDIKIDIPDEIIRKHANYILYRNYDSNLISINLIPLIDLEKFMSGDFKLPLNCQKEDFIDPYVEFEDIVENINLKRFTPIRMNYNKDEVDDKMNNYDDEENINKGESNNNLNFSIFRNFNENENTENNVKINSCTNYNSKSINIFNTIKNNSFNFYSNLPGKSILDNINDDVKSVKSRSSSKNSINRSRDNLNESLSKLTQNSIKIKELQMDLNNDNVIKVPDSIMEIFNNNLNENNINNNNNQIENLQTLKKAKMMLYSLADKEKSKNYKIVSNSEHKSIFDAIEMIREVIYDKKALEEMKVKAFIEKIVNNQNLITEYRSLLKEKILTKL